MAYKVGVFSNIINKVIFLGLLNFITSMNLLEAKVANNQTRVNSRDNLLALYEKAETSYIQGDLSSALQNYLEALILDASNTRILYRIGEIYYLLDNQKESLHYITRLLQILPQNIDARKLAVKSLIRLGAINEAKIQLEWLKKVSNDSEIGKIIQDLERLEEGNKGRLEEVIKKYKISNFIKEVQGSLRVNLELAKYNLQKGNLRNANKYIQVAEDLVINKSRETRSFIEIQLYRLLLHLYNMEIKEFGQRLIKLKSLLNTETYNSFLRTYNTANELMNKSKSELLKFIIGVAIGAEHENVAIKMYEENISRIIEDLVLIRMMAEAYISTQNYDQAERMLLKLYSLAPEVAEYAMTLAKFYITAKLDISKAESFLNIAVQKYPDDAKVMVIDGIISCLKGDVTRGIEIIRQSLKKQNNDLLLSKLATKILSEYEKSKSRGERFYNIKSLILLPARNSNVDTVKIGEENLNRGLYFVAIRDFVESRDLAEIGRGYLGFARYLLVNGENEAADFAARYGKEILQEAQKYREFAGRASLYLAIYYFENKDSKLALKYVEDGLRLANDESTKLKLRMLYSKII